MSERHNAIAMCCNVRIYLKLKILALSLVVKVPGLCGHNKSYNDLTLKVQGRSEQSISQKRPIYGVKSDDCAENILPNSCN